MKKLEQGLIFYICGAKRMSYCMILKFYYPFEQLPKQNSAQLQILLNKYKQFTTIYLN